MLSQKIVKKVKSFFPSTSNKDEFIPYKKRFKIFDISFDFWIVDKVGQQWYDYDFWNNAIEFKVLNEMLKQDYHVLEFGLHHGFSATFMNKKIGVNGKYTGVELSPKATIYTMGNLKLNEIGSNCRIINAAGGDKTGIVGFSNETSANSFVMSSGKGVPIEQVAGDTLLESMDNKIDCLKIDVEGFEINVLEGSKKILSQYPHIALEIHTESIEVYGSTVSRIFELINLENYNAYYFWNSGNAYINPTTHKLKYFTIKDMPSNGIINLFLFSKTKGSCALEI